MVALQFNSDGAREYTFKSVLTCLDAKLVYQLAEWYVVHQDESFSKNIHGAGFSGRMRIQNDLSPQMLSDFDGSHVSNESLIA